MPASPLARVSLTYLGRAKGGPIDMAEVEKLLGSWHHIMGTGLEPLEAQLGTYPSTGLFVYGLAVLRMSRERFGNSYQDVWNLRYVRKQFVAAAAQFPAGQTLATFGSVGETIRELASVTTIDTGGIMTVPGSEGDAGSSSASAAQFESTAPGVASMEPRSDDNGIDIADIARQGGQSDNGVSGSGGAVAPSSLGTSDVAELAVARRTSAAIQELLLPAWPAARGG